MSIETAKEKLTGHGKVICKKCNTVIISCRCIEKEDNILYDLCDDCEWKLKDKEKIK